MVIHSPAREATLTLGNVQEDCLEGAVVSVRNKLLNKIEELRTDPPPRATLSNADVHAHPSVAQ